MSLGLPTFPSGGEEGQLGQEEVSDFPGPEEDAGVSGAGGGNVLQIMASDFSFTGSSSCVEGGVCGGKPQWQCVPGLAGQTVPRISLKQDPQRAGYLLSPRATQKLYPVLSD